MHQIKEKSDDLILTAVVKINVWSAYKIAKATRITQDMIPDINSSVNLCNESETTIPFRVADFINLLITLRLVTYSGNIVSSKNYNYFLNNSLPIDDITEEIKILNNWQNEDEKKVIYAYASTLLKTNRLQKDRDVNFKIVLQPQKFYIES